MTDIGTTDNEAGFVAVPPVLAEQSSLGNILEVHRTPFPWETGTWLFVFLCFFLAIATGAFLGWTWTAPGNEARGIVVGGLLALVFIAVTVGFLRDALRPFAILVFEGGMVEIRGRRVEAFHWPSVFAYFEQRSRSGEFSPGWIRRQDGRWLAFTQFDHRSARKLDDLARKEVWKRLFPGALQTYENGGTVDYGTLGVSKTGLTRKGRLLVWNDVLRLRIESPDNLVIRQRGKFFAWMNMRTRGIPNYFILRYFIEQHADIVFQR